MLWNEVLWYERKFDIIYQTYLTLAHFTHARTRKTIIEDVWWGLPKNMMQLYTNICPDYLQSSKPPIAEEMNPLQNDNFQDYWMPGTVRQWRRVFGEISGILKE
jgi:hypothetical protein